MEELEVNYEDMIKRLREPFAFKDVEWKIQVTTQDKARGMAVAYIDSRAIQNRLDEVIGTFNWRNQFMPWQNNAQLCGLSIYDSDRGEWVTKYDGAENTDIEPIKGGLSDSFKRAACVWGIGRYLYEIDGIWVEVEQRGKSSIIKDNQYAKLESEYNKAVSKMFGAAVTPPVKQSATVSQANPVTAVAEYRVQSVKPSGKASQLLELVNADGEVISAYIKNSDEAVLPGSKLQNVDLVQKQSSYGQYNLINGYRIAA
jgi:hypothetical protein